MIHELAKACVEFANALRVLGAEPKGTGILATVNVRRSAFLAFATDASLRVMNPRSGQLLGDELLVQVNNGYQIQILAEDSQ